MALGFPTKVTTLALHCRSPSLPSPVFQGLLVQSIMLIALQYNLVSGPDVRERYFKKTIDSSVCAWKDAKQRHKILRLSVYQGDKK